MMDYWRKQPERALFAEGDVVDVRAWWTYPPGQNIRCRVEKVYAKGAPPIYYDVRPIGGANPHGRMVKQADCSAASARTFANDSD